MAATLSPLETRPSEMLLPPVAKVPHVAKQTQDKYNYPNSPTIVKIEAQVRQSNVPRKFCRSLKSPLHSLLVETNFSTVLH